MSVRHWNRLLGGVLYATASRIDWATLLRRTFGADALECPSCHGRLRVIQCVTASALVLSILERLGIATDVPALARARDPPEVAGDECTT